MPQSWMQKILPGVEFNKPFTVPLKAQLFSENDVNVFMLRLDQMHPYISGNKFFKLIYFLQEAQKMYDKKIITFGGAYSNHLAATAFACEQSGIESIGIVRGEKPTVLSHTLQFCQTHRMKLHFITRDDFKKINQEKFLSQLKKDYGKHVLIPEGGFSIKGKEGAGLIHQFIAPNDFSHICLAVGTATTFAGLVEKNENERNIIGFSVLKNLADIDQRFQQLNVSSLKKYCFIGDYHFGGYAKKTAELIFFMNNFYRENRIALDFVYTGKMMFGIYDLIEKKYFRPGSKILCIHTGGLQGNHSLPMGMLNY